MPEMLVLDSDDCTTKKGKNKSKTFSTTCILLFLVILIPIETTGYVFFKENENERNCNETVNARIDRLESILARRIEDLKNDNEKNNSILNAGFKKLESDYAAQGIEDLKSMCERNFTMMNSTLTALKLDIEQIKKGVTGNATKSADSATPVGQLILAALNEPHTGDMNGLTGADSLCREQARAAGFNGTFQSFLGDEKHSLYTNFPPQLRNLPIVNTRGEKIFSSWDSLFSGDQGKFPSNTRFYSFNGKDVGSDPTWYWDIIWHGVGDNINCNSWHSTDGGGLASQISPKRKLLDQGVSQCVDKHIVLCIQNSIA